jgi:hypothetical protein
MCEAIIDYSLGASASSSFSRSSASTSSRGKPHRSVAALCNSTTGIYRIIKQFIHRRKGGIRNDLWQMDIEARLTCFAFILAPCLLHNLVTVASFGSTLSLAAVCQFLNSGTPSEAIVIDRGFWFCQTLALLEN